MKQLSSLSVTFKFNPKEILVQKIQEASFRLKSDLKAFVSVVFQIYNRLLVIQKFSQCFDLSAKQPKDEPNKNVVAFRELCSYRGSMVSCFCCKSFKMHLVF